MTREQKKAVNDQWQEDHKAEIEQHDLDVGQTFELAASGYDFVIGSTRYERLKFVGGCLTEAV